MKNHLHRLMTLFFLPTLIISCASFPSENQDPAKNNKVTYNKDLKECKEDYQETPSGTHIRQWIGCMNLKGWK
ncbi:hypothetical protein [Polynucleobacter sp. UB-Tiil-W10]|uniref:hypothetical protein n=1 Tax=Polynucleobacter sp. UB-Tiil-W10 TaxID=1855648 RepID=UPI001C0D8B4A|nr:hypothetical protein [Polynucleobacter sp. UB-Tiil-W10]MBU3540785.1 hypothetical protein [Polynucleobacter sp. UB-Tiil-W10]